MKVLESFNHLSSKQIHPSNKLFNKRYLLQWPALMILASLMLWQLPASAELPGSSQEVSSDNSKDRSNEIATESSVNINTAGADELSTMLKGVGSKRAQAIVAYRNANGDFTSADQLVNVKGVGEKMVANNRHVIVLE